VSVPARLAEPPVAEEDEPAMEPLSPIARRVRELALARRGEPIEIVGRSAPLRTLLGHLDKIADFDEPVLLVGESGVGKESMAQAIHLLDRRRREPFVSVNCPQFQDGNLTVSELFGHRRGSFTGAVGDRKGLFETADGGVIFLDEIGDLHMSAQVMLLRALASGEFRPLGSDRVRRANVRVIAATNRPLDELAGEREFRRDLLFRLRYFLFQVPPLRERGDDWRLLAEHVLARLIARYGVARRLSSDSLRLLAAYHWPGNVRELISVMTTGYALADGDLIEPRNFADALESGGGEGDRLGRLYRRLARGEGSFWEVVQRPFLDRELNRREVSRLVARGLRDSGGSYRGLLDLWHLRSADYQRLMGFLRHHRLKPDSARRGRR
jgi:transcriptional regulator with GAF, ATPase, and Fis domain